jgi:hypothetical protein
MPDAVADRRARTALAVLAAMALAAGLAYPRLQLPVSFDGAQMYLPMARRLLDQGLSFLARPESLAMGPMSYVYPAMLGASEKWVRWSNVLLFCATAALAFHAAALAHSRRAGVTAAFLVALSPTLRPYMADVLTEPPFVFLVAAWMVAVAQVARGRGTGWIVAGGAALTLAALTRPAIGYFAPCMVAFFAWRAWRATAPERAVERRLAAMHAVAFVLCAAWMLRNYAMFGLGSIAAGAGGALFLGINTLVDGFDPIYYGLGFDVGAVARDMHHLSLEGDRILRAVALVQLADTPLPVLAEMFARKALAFVFVTATDTSGEPLPWLRTWRVVLVVFAACAVLFRRRSPAVAAAAAVCAYMLAAHLPLLYTHRYSVGALDVALALLAAIGLAECLGRPVRLACALTAATLGVALGLVLMGQAGPGAPRIDRSPTQVLWSRDAAIRGLAIVPGTALEVAVMDAPRLHPWDNSLITIALAVTPGDARGGCDALRLRYRKAEEAGYAEGRVVRVPITADGRMRALTIGTTVPLRLNHEGVLRIEFECPYPALVEMGTISIAAPRRAMYYRERYLERASPAGETR